MTGQLILIACVAALFAVAFTVAVRRQETPEPQIDRFRKRFVELEIIVGGTLIPALRRATDAMAAFNAAYLEHTGGSAASQKEKP